MKFIGIILIIFGGLWVVGRLLNQPKMFQIIKEKVREGGLLLGIRRYFIAELFGLGLGLGAMGLGLYLFSPEFLYLFFFCAGILLSVIFLWGSSKLGSLPQASIIIFGIVGFFMRGFLGLIGGLALGWVVVTFAGLLSIPLIKKLNLGSIKKRYRLAIANEFYLQYKEDILATKKFQSMEEEKIIEIFSDYINQIEGESARLTSPEQLHKHDMDISMRRANFGKGGENWINQFKEKNEKMLMREYLDFCIDAIYVNYCRYI